MSDEPEPFTYDGGRVDPGETQQFRYAVSETYLGDPVRIPVTIINGPRPGPTAFLSAAIHGDELNGIEVLRTEIERDAVTLGDTYRVGLLSPIETDSQSSNEATQSATISDSRAEDESDDRPPVAEGEIREVIIEATDDQGDGIAKVDQGYVIIVPDGKPGETLVVEIDTVRPNVAFAQAIGNGMNE